MEEKYIVSARKYRPSTFASVVGQKALTATLRNARIAGIDSVTGSIEPGKSADMIVTRRNPLEDLGALRHVRMVFARGRLFRDVKVKKMARVERELDKFV